MAHKPVKMVWMLYRANSSWVGLATLAPITLRVGGDMVGGNRSVC